MASHVAPIHPKRHRYFEPDARLQACITEYESPDLDLDPENKEFLRGIAAGMREELEIRHLESFTGLHYSGIEI